MIVKATPHDIPSIQAIAENTWPTAYGNILSADQIVYMLNLMYSEKAMLEQLAQLNHHFYLFLEKKIPVAFLSIQPNWEKNIAKIHKIYALPSTQGKGIGKALMQFAEQFAVKHQQSEIRLNVNRNNRAVSFYKKMGYAVLKEEDIAIGNNYWMEDYVMHKLI